ncbi:sensor histidine kinase [Marinibacterium sp. SX1]|uniref:sensor histidine kinase n=1 Tax=Marinibacterium sp. SX1 TaxID=3388424 RepID=UPI003D176967
MRLLIVDDNEDDRDMLRRAVARMPDPPVRIDEVFGLDKALDWLDPVARSDVVLLDYSLPGCDGMEALNAIHDRAPFAAVVMVTGQGNEDIAVRAMRCGAQDYLTKGNITPEGLHRSVTNALERAAMQREIDDHRRNLETFAHVLVHDLRGPLQTIRGAIEMLEEDLPAGIAAEMAEVMGFITGGAARMEALILSLRSYTRIDLAPPQFGPVDLGDALDMVCRTLAAELDAAGAEVFCDGALPNIRGDKPQIEQLLQNLVANAVKYNRSDRPRVHVSAEPVEGGWELAVSDNGIGIDPARAAEIFEPFRRLHRSEEFAGTGLGLATCRKIADRHGARIWCEGRPGVGSTFIVHLPAAEAQAAGPISEAG